MLVAMFAPAIVGTKPIVCRYKGDAIPRAGIFRLAIGDQIFYKDNSDKSLQEPQEERSRKLGHLAADLSGSLSRGPRRRMAGQPGNPTSDQGSPSRYNWSDHARGRRRIRQMIHGTTIALLVGFVSMGIA